MSSKSARVAFCGGGSGGHLTPAIAIAQNLLERHPEIQVSYLTSAREIDARILHLPKHSMANFLHHVALPMQSGFAWNQSVGFAMALWRSVRIARNYFVENRPERVLGLGGFASVPGIVAARMCRIPVVLLETNTVPGRANRYLSRLAELMFTGWPVCERTTYSLFCKTQRVGVPVRSEFLNQREAQIVDPSIVILGGSQGAGRLNTIVTESLLANPTLLSGWKIFHQTGSHDFSRTAERYSCIHPVSAAHPSNPGQSSVRGLPTIKPSPEITVQPFFDNMEQLLSKASLVISRCGAVTLAEIAATECPSILLPLRTAADDHQLTNAEFFVDAKASVMIDDSTNDAASQLLAAIAFCSEENQAAEMRRNAGRLFTAKAAETVADALAVRPHAVEES